jgi:hypothetical protein
MKTAIPFLFFRQIAATAFVVVAICVPARAADSQSWAGQYTEKKFLGGRAVFQLTIEQSGSAMQVSFDAAWVDGHGAAPKRQGPQKLPAILSPSNLKTPLRIPGPAQSLAPATTSSSR